MFYSMVKIQTKFFRCMWVNVLSLRVASLCRSFSTTEILTSEILTVDLLTPQSLQATSREWCWAVSNKILWGRLGSVHFVFFCKFHPGILIRNSFYKVDVNTPRTHSSAPSPLDVFGHLINNDAPSVTIVYGVSKPETLNPIAGTEKSHYPLYRGWHPNPNAPAA